MSTESKKLQTVLDCGQIKPAAPLADIFYFEALEHDTVIAHEQREVVRKLVLAIHGLSEWRTMRNDSSEAVMQALFAADPFLEG